MNDVFVECVDPNGSERKKRSTHKYGQKSPEDFIVQRLQIKCKSAKKYRSAKCFWVQPFIIVNNEF